MPGLRTVEVGCEWLVVSGTISPELALKLQAPSNDYYIRISTSTDREYGVEQGVSVPLIGYHLPATSHGLCRRLLRVIGNSTLQQHPDSPSVLRSPSLRPVLGPVASDDHRRIFGSFVLQSGADIHVDLQCL